MEVLLVLSIMVVAAYLLLFAFLVGCVLMAVYDYLRVGWIDREIEKDRAS